MEDSQIVQLYWDRDEQAIPHTAEKYGGYCLSVAGNIGKAFTFEGFLSPKQGRRRERLAALFASGDAFMIYESPFRVVKTLKDIAEAGRSRLVVGRELTKAHEEIIAGPADDILADFSSRDSIKGEFAIIVVPEEP